MSAPIIKDARSAKLAVIHIAKKQLGLDDEVYRALLEGATGKTSCKGMSLTQLDEVIAAFKARGLKPHLKQSRKGRRRYAPEAAQGYQHKIYAMWWAMAERGVVDKSKMAVRKWVERQTGRSAPEFLGPSEANSCIEALKSWGAREGVVFDD